MIYIGIDNGVTGSIALIMEGDSDSLEVKYFPTPVKKALNYTKTQAFLTRVDSVKLDQIWQRLLPNDDDAVKENVFCLIERPMINPMRWVASMSAMRALEATLVLLEQWCIPYEYVDSKEWQSVLLPKVTPVNPKLSAKQKKKAKQAQHDALKAMSLLKGKQLFPLLNLGGFQDADGLLIAEYCRRKWTGVK